MDTSRNKILTDRKVRERKFAGQPNGTIGYEVPVDAFSLPNDDHESMLLERYEAEINGGGLLAAQEAAMAADLRGRYASMLKLNDDDHNDNLPENLPLKSLRREQAATKYPSFRN